MTFVNSRIKILRETFQEQLNTKLESLKYENLEDGGHNFSKIIYGAANTNISENALCIIEKRELLRVTRVIDNIKIRGL